MFHQNLAIPLETVLETPIGNLYVDIDKAQTLIDSCLFIKDSSPYYQEHSLEVQLPFIKTLLPDCNVIPISVGMTDPLMIKRGAKEIAAIMDNHTILIVSNDLSHYHSLKIAKQLDETTIKHILELSADNLMTKDQKKEIECCGLFPILLLLTALNELDVTIATVLKYDTSASTSFDDEHVVGYVSIAFY